MEPLQTWWATELYPSKDDENFGVAGDFEMVKAADAQATIAALQAREGPICGPAQNGCRLAEGGGGD